MIQSQEVAHWLLVFQLIKFVIVHPDDPDDPIGIFL
jgi:hypothetical protein